MGSLRPKRERNDAVTLVDPTVCDVRHVWHDPTRYRSTTDSSAKPLVDPRHGDSRIERTLDSAGSSTRPTISRIQHRRRQSRPPQDRSVDFACPLRYLYGTATMQECSPLGIGIRSSYVLPSLSLFDTALILIFCSSSDGTQGLSV
jgi:hypothetical protein